MADNRHCTLINEYVGAQIRNQTCNILEQLYSLGFIEVSLFIRFFWEHSCLLIGYWAALKGGLKLSHSQRAIFIQCT